MNIDKTSVFQQLLSELNSSLQIATQAANTAKELATHEQSKPETQYDTVGLEASYLAHGQSQRVAELQLAIADWQQLQAKEFNLDSEVSAGALVELVDEDDNVQLYLLGNYSGGLRLEINELKITVISLASPIGMQLKDKTYEEEVEYPKGSNRYYLITSLL